jgi:ketopantoate hydroxymethyltransferase
MTIPQAILADRSGVDCILVGDSLGMTTIRIQNNNPSNNG